MKSILITGGSGFFGTACAKHLLLNTDVSRIVLLSRGEFRQFQVAQTLAPHDPDKRLRFMIGDVRERDRLRRAFNGIEAVIHAAALKRIEVGAYNPVEMVKTNVDGAINVIEAAQDMGVRKVVALSSDKAYQPISPYGCSKALAEAIFLAANNTTGWFGPRFACTRYGNVWRSTGSVVPVWEQAVAQGREVTMTDPEVTRFYMTIEEAVELVLTTLLTMKGGELAIPHLPAYRLGDLAEAMGLKPRITGLPTFEKQHESMGPDNCSADARRMSIDELREALREGKENHQRGPGYQDEEQPALVRSIKACA